MPTPTYTLIDSVTLGGDFTSVTFSGISATGKGDLKLVMSGGASGDIFMYFNGDTTDANYSSVRIYAVGANSGSSLTNNGLIGFAANPMLLTVEVMDFSASNKQKSSLMRGNGSATELRGNRWSSNSAITSLGVYITSAFNAGMTFNLYQIVSE
jgi:hypothetical protein